MPLHVLDNLTNLSNTGTARTNLGLGTGDSPEFAGLTITTNLSVTNSITTNAITSTEYNLTGTINGELVASKNVAGWAFANKTSPPLTSDTSPQGVFFKPDGSIMYILGSNAASTYRVYAHNVPTPWDVSTVSAAATLNSGLIEAAMTGLYFSPDGRYFFTVSSSSRIVRRFTMSVGSEWDVSTGVASGTFTFPAAAPAMTAIRGITFKPDGTKMYVYDNNTTGIYEYNLSTAWDVTTASVFASIIIAATSGTSDITINSDGTRLIAIASAGTFNQVVFEYTLPTPWSVTGAIFKSRMFRSTNSVVFPAGGPAVLETGPTGIYYNDILNKCFFVGSGADRVQEIDATPQPAIVGTRPIILSNPANSVIDRVIMNSLQITDGTASISGTTGALLVVGGIGVSNNINCNGFMAANLFQAGVNSGFTWSGRSLINSPSDGVIRLTNNAVTGFDRLQFGGITASFPAIKRNGTGIDIRDAADVGFTNLRANQITATGPIIFPSLPYMTVITFTGAAYTGAMVFVNDEIGGACMAYYDGADWRRIDNNTVIATPP